jgi:hypothetical protein
MVNGSVVGVAGSPPDRKIYVKTLASFIIDWNAERALPTAGL